MKRLHFKKGIATILLSVLFIPISLESHIGTTPLEIKAAESNLEINLPEVYILPTSPLYDLKLTWEEVRLYLSKDPEQRTELLLNLSEVRLAETVKLLRSNQLQLAEKTYQDHKKYSQQASQLHTEHANKNSENPTIKNKFLANEHSNKLFTVLAGEYEVKWEK